ncbi:hypothetical protein EMCRGX_G029245 [Ephydatia muelleri]
MKDMLRITGRQAFEGVQLVVRVKVAESMGHPEVGESTVWLLMMPTDSGPMEAVGMQVVMVGAISSMESCSSHKKNLCSERYHQQLDITVASPLTSVILGESCQVVGAAASVAENRKMQTYSSKCQELGWACTPLAVETYGNWGEVAQGTLYPTLPLANPEALVVADIEAYMWQNTSMVEELS